MCKKKKLSRLPLYFSSIYLTEENTVWDVDIRIILYFVQTYRVGFDKDRIISQYIYFSLFL